MNEQASIYWRRRMVAAGGVVIALVVVGWAAGGFFGEDSIEVAGTGSEIRDSQPPSGPPEPDRSSTTSASPSPSPAGPSEPVAPPPVPPPPPPVPPPPSPDPNLPCPDTAMQVAVELGAPQYKVGQRPELTLVVVNAGPVVCTRDVSRGLRELVVTDGANRIWSSNDCYSVTQLDSRILRAGERLVFELRWAGRTSAPGCPAKRANVRAGAYSVIGRLGALSSPPVPLVLV
ncbi:MAG: hypothetical protein ABW215_14420 [Kibdelosporangium sp.]